MLVGATSAFRPWTDAERAGVAAAYASGGIAAAVSAYPHRSRSALFHAAKRAGVKRRPHWTRAEDKRLRIEWGSLSMRELVRLFGRPRRGITIRAGELGLVVGCPPGFEYLSNAAARCGYEPTQLRRILAWAGVEIREPYSGVRTTWRHVVDSHDVTDAVERWHRTETLHGAARRHGVSDSVVRARLQWFGVPLEKAARGVKAHYRVDSAVVDGVMG